MPIIKGLTFERWIQHVFDHPEKDPHWYTDPGAEHWNGENAAKAEYIARTFEEAAACLSRFSDRQLDTGLHFIVGWNYAIDALAEDVPPAARARVVRSTVPLFESLFAARCVKLDWGGGYPLYRICLAFWELFPPAESSDKIDALERILSIDNAMCQYSALRGLGLGQPEAPERTAGIIDAYLQRHPEPDFPLRSWALNARKGNMD